METSDRLLIKKIKGGDQSAFQSLFDKYYPRMLVSANRILRDKAVSQDAAQDVFVLFWKNREKLEEKLNVNAYLSRAVINKALTILKSRKRHVGDAEDFLNLQVSRADSSQEVIEGKELKIIIHHAIDQLPEKRRMIFTLCRLEGLSHKEIAEKLGISPKTIENQMTAALKQLRSALRKHYNGPLEFFWLLLLHGIGGAALSVVLF